MSKMNFVMLLLWSVLLFGSAVEAFVVVGPGSVARVAFRQRFAPLQAFGDDLGDLVNKLSDATSAVPPPPPPPPAPAAMEAAASSATDTAAVAAAASSAADTAASAVADTVASSPTDASSFSVPELPDLGNFDLGGLGGDLPIVPIAIGAIAVLAGVALLSGGKDKDVAAPSPAPSPAASAPAPVAADNESKPEPTPNKSDVDVSIPYDAAAQLAYEQSDKSMDYESFKKKYEEDAVEEVKAKSKSE